MAIAITAGKHEPHREHKTFMQRLLDGVERVGNKVPHPVIIFVALILLVIVLSHIVYLTGASVTYESINAETHDVEMKTTAAKSLLSAEGIRFMYSGVAAFMSVGRHPLAGLAASFASNVGVLGGKDGRSAGDATNVVTDYVRINGESRSDSEQFTSAITAAFKDAFTKAAAQVRDDKGETAQAKFDGRADYFPFRLPDDAPAVVHAKHAAESIGLKPTTQFSRGGLDSNWFARHGLPSVTFGAGQHEIHTVKEYVDLPEFADGCRMAVALATIES
ncbi:MAG: M20/M25/M40 family metallo-hydrolase [Phycisphaerales bacterium]|nr:M20/M25/M40 family metallo-hydrolase [Phycisphaerales bacterium]MCI0677338.1 M20/M25/M40 family metallo-hydrolase [Phycisphaerales bacterium]